MKIKDFIKKLKKFDPELEITITDGYQGVSYHTNGCLIEQYEDFEGETKGFKVDIGIGGLRIN